MCQTRINNFFWPIVGWAQWKSEEKGGKKVKNGWIRDVKGQRRRQILRGVRRTCARTRLETSVLSLWSVNATKSLETQIPIIKTINSGEPVREGAVLTARLNIPDPSRSPRLYLQINWGGSEGQSFTLLRRPKNEFPCLSPFNNIYIIFAQWVCYLRCRKLIGK